MPQNARRGESTLHTTVHYNTLYTKGAGEAFLANKKSPSKQ